MRFNPLLACLLLGVLVISWGPAQAQLPTEITLTKTVGTDPNVCSASTSITVEPGTEVFYCYTVTNSGSTTVTVHDLEDSELGTLLDDFVLTLGPGDFYSVTAASSIFVDTLNDATWTVRSSTAPTAPVLDEAYARAAVFVNDPPLSQITLTKTVGLDPNTCGLLDFLAVPSGTEVYYCYTVTNTGTTTVRYHTLVDDVLGTLLMNEELFLNPGEMYTVTAASTITADVINTATWTVQNNVQGPELAAADDTAEVVVVLDPTPTNTEVPPTATNTPVEPTPTETPLEPTPTETEVGPTATNTPVPPTATNTPVAGEDCDSGYYVLDSFGGRHRVGNPVVINGPLYFGNDIARDMERLVCAPLVAGVTNEDLYVLDGLGGTHIVQNQACEIMQEFYFGEVAGIPEGRAVDIEMTADDRGFWVLADHGGIYRAGSAKDLADPALVPNTNTGTLGFDIPITGTMRDPNLPDPGGASLRAVSLIVIDEDLNSRADGYVVLDSMGGHHQLNPDGTPVTAGSAAGEPVNDPDHLLDPASYVWPFFPGLDIARDMELFSTQQGVVILDGWDGIHPVPVDVESNPVFFANNVVSASDNTPLQAVGMPYVVGGFDDPDTMGTDEGDETTYGIDAASIFTDLEFSVGCANGLYTLDSFGGVFVMGAARPNATEPVPNFGGSPYFYPFLWAEDMEIFGADETGFSILIR